MPFTARAPRRWAFTLAFVGGVTLALALVALLILSPGLFPSYAKEARLGSDLPLQVLVEPPQGLTPEQVAALPDAAFSTLRAPFNAGYTRDTYWFRIAAPAQRAALEPALDADHLWLKLVPPYLDRVSLFQPDATGWREVASGDTVPMAQRLRVRQLVFPLMADQPMLLRITTASPLHFEGSVWREAALMTRLAHIEWASGLHQGVGLALTLLLTGAALVLRMHKLVALAAAAGAAWLHGAADRGYLQLWLPESLAHWGDPAVSIGTLVLPALLAWQTREIMTRGTSWQRTDKALIAIGVAPLLCLPSIALGCYSDWAWVGIVAPWVAAGLWAVVAWTNLLRQGATLVNVLMVGPSTLIVALGSYIACVYLGWARLPDMEASLLWQFVTLMTSILATLAVGAGLVEQFQQSSVMRARLIEELKESELALDLRVRQRTSELLQTHNSLQAALDRERLLRSEQQQFFNMVNHEFRTPLAVIDSAAAEQQSFPTATLHTQAARAVQIRRACRRMTTLVDSCLVSDRLDADAFQLQLRHMSVQGLVEDAGQIVRWSDRHALQMDLQQAPTAWTCDPMLLGIALSNLVDNAVKYAPPGPISLAARMDLQGRLRLSVCNAGTSLAPEQVRQLFRRGQRARQDTKGFGLGLWAARRIGHLHGGDVTFKTEADRTCFTLVLPPLTAEEPAPGASSLAMPTT